MSTSVMGCIFPNEEGTSVEFFGKLTEKNFLAISTRKSLETALGG
jgi:hypothetical protein